MTPDQNQITGSDKAMHDFGVLVGMALVILCSGISINLIIRGG